MSSQISRTHEEHDIAKSEIMSKIHDQLHKIEKGDFESFDAERFKKMNIREY